MGQDINEMMQEAPVLTLDPFGETKEEVVEVKEEQVEELDVLTPEEKKMVADFAAKIDLRSSNAILQYGAGAQKKIADFSESALENVKTKDLGEVGDMLAGVVTELKSFDEEEEEKGIFGFFKKGGNKLANMKAKYDKAEVNVNKICDALEGHQIQLISKNFRCTLQPGRKNYRMLRRRSSLNWRRKLHGQGCRKMPRRSMI